MSTCLNKRYRIFVSANFPTVQPHRSPLTISYHHHRLSRDEDHPNANMNQLQDVFDQSQKEDDVFTFNEALEGKEPTQQYAAADSASASPGAKTFVACKVCGDKASGYHYGVTSCEGCKGFFRRSIQKQIEYKCLRDGKCLVIRLNRNRCQFCRFKKCLTVGMSRDSVRYGRVPKRSRERSIEEPGAPISLSPGSASNLEEANEIARLVATAHRTHCGLSDPRVLTGPLPQPQPGSPETATSSSETIDNQKIWLWQQLATRITPAVQKVVEFAKRVPGFPDLSQDDQLILIKMGFFEVWLSNISRISNDSSLILEDGFRMTRQQIEVMYDTNFAAQLFGFISNVSSLSLTETEQSLFVAAVLVTADRNGVTDIKTVQKNQDKLIETMKLQTTAMRAATFASSIGSLLGDLRAVGGRHMELLDWYRAKWKQLRLPPLFAEIFDIPKCDDDLQL